jgi:hypothetical protein
VSENPVRPVAAIGLTATFPAARVVVRAGMIISRQRGHTNYRRRYCRNTSFSEDSKVRRGAQIDCSRADGRNTAQRRLCNH